MCSSAWIMSISKWHCYGPWSQGNRGKCPPLLPPPGPSLAPMASNQLLTNSQQRENMEAWGNSGLLETRDHSVGPEGWFQNCQTQMYTGLTKTLYKQSAAGNRMAMGSPTECQDQIQSSRANSWVVISKQGIQMYTRIKKKKNSVYSV